MFLLSPTISQCQLMTLFLFTEGRLSQAESLFYYHDGDSYLTYNPSITSFTPTFGLQALATNPALNATANMICGDDYSCRYDIAITGSADIGQSTHDINQMNKKMTSDLSQSLLHLVDYIPTSCILLRWMCMHQALCVFAHDTSLRKIAAMRFSKLFIRVCP